MTLRIATTPDGGAFKCAWVFPNVISYDTHFKNPDFPWGDAFVHHTEVLEGMLLPPVLTSVRRATRTFQSAPDFQAVVLRGVPPIEQDYSYRADYARHFSLLSYVKMGRDDEKRVTAHVKESGDNNVIQSSYTGYASYAPDVSLMSPFDGYDTFYSHHGVSWPGFTAPTSAPTGIRRDSGVYSYVGTVPRSFNGSFAEDFISAIGSHIAQHGHLRFDQTISGRNIRSDLLSFDLTSSLTDSGAVLYTVTSVVQLKVWGSGHPFGSQNWVGFNSTFQLTLTDGDPIPHDIFYNGEAYPFDRDLIVDYSVVNDHYAYGSAMVPGVNFNPVPWQAMIGSWNGSLDPGVLVPVSKVVNEAPDLPPSLSSKVLTRRPRSTRFGASLAGLWGQMVHDDLENLRPANFYSTQRALEGHVDFLRNNYVESFAELITGIGLLPSVSPLIQLVAAVTTGNLVGTVYSFADLITSTTLWWQFGISPTASSILEVATNWDGIERRLKADGLWGERTLYGSFRYDLPESSYGLGQPELVARSKLRVEFKEDAMLKAILASNGIGLAPVASSFWQALPFSFAVDWYFNIGRRLEAAEDRVLFLLIPLKHATHSIAVSEEFDDQALNAFNIERFANSADAPGLRYYNRYTSGFYPPLKDVKYDYLAAHGPPSLFTAGSLLFQLLS